MTDSKSPVSDQFIETGVTTITLTRSYDGLWDGVYTNHLTGVKVSIVNADTLSELIAELHKAAKGNLYG